MIFSHLDDKSNASNALVSVKWSTLALNILWRTLTDLSRLFGILQPLFKVGAEKDDPYAWRVSPDASDWQRLERYSKRVRRLIFDADACSLPLEATVFEDASRTRTSLAILPNLVHLDWRAPLPLSMIFMTPNVKSFVLWIPETDITSLRSYFRDVTTRMPNLTVVDVHTIVPMHKIEDDMVFLLGNLPKLRKIVFPRYHLTTRVAETLSLLESLGTVEFQYHADQGLGAPEDTTGVFQPKLQLGAFPSLYDMSTTITLGDAVAFMKQTFAPTNLTALYIDSPLMESPAIVQELLEHLGQCCQLLETLGILTLIEDKDAAKLADVPAENRINFSHLRSLLLFPNLAMFELIHQNPLDLTFEDLQQLAQSWPSLRKLILNNEPAILDCCPLTLDALLPFARHCRELEHLGMFVNASSADIPSTYAATFQIKPFARLRRLSMGTSIISEPGQVALFLSQICPKNTALDCGVTWDHASSDNEEAIERYELIAERCERWSKVEELLPLMTQLRAEERDRTRLLTNEVNDLRMRSSVMMDTLRKGTAASSGDSCIPL
uniref:F-box domain-containing protein n=1 Tax=Mycena chlorophos TaxID=658473 RepID=A0ABQ0MC39_MYCCL|nr:predicted protein [Mycena chlorophos]